MSCMIGLLRLMEEGHFTALLESHEDQKSLKVKDSYDIWSWGHSFSTSTQRGRGVEQKCKSCLQGGRGVDIAKYVRKKPLLASIL